MTEQINSSGNMPMAGGGGSADQEKHAMLDAAAEFMSLPENRERIKDVITRG